MNVELDRLCDREKEILAIHAILVYTTDCAREYGDKRLIDALQNALRRANECMNKC